MVVSGRIMIIQGKSKKKIKIYFFRKKLKAILSLKEGEILITLQERGNKVNLINTVSGEEDVLKEVDDDDVDIFKLSETQFGLFEEGKITLVTFN